MDYLRQSAFLRRYRAWATLGVLTLSAAAVIFVRAAARFATTAQAALFVIGNLALIVAVPYVPKYLHMRTDFARRSVSWQVRMRWILLALALLYWVLAVRAHDAMRFLACFGALAIVNLIAATVGRGRAHAGGFVWLLYLATDLALLFYLIGLLRSPLLYALVAGISAFLLLVTAVSTLRAAAWLVAGLYLGVLAVAASYPRAYAIAWLAALAVTALGLSMTAEKHHQQSYSQVASELAAMLGRGEPEMREFVLTANQAMVERWNHDRPDTLDPAALARWYTENSHLYLGANAEFHLTNKHIAFTLDVLRLARGRCLDFGAGNGDLSLALARAGRPTVHFDVPGTSLEFARWRARRESLNVAFLTDRAELVRTAEREGPFDTIVSLDVLEHIADLDAVLRMFGAVLAPAGRLIVNVPFGETQSHPMHLNHAKDDVPASLRQMGLRNLKTWALMVRGSELLRKSDLLIYEKPPQTQLDQRT